ncbi:MAG: NAD(P)H-binding protein [Paracoccaceae bacterium]
MPENILYVAGATGYIGCEIVKRALERGYTVHASVRPTSKNALPQNDRLILDILRSEGEKTIFNVPTGASVISCISSRTGTAKDAYNIDYQMNMSLLDCARVSDAKIFLMLSAICVQKPKLAFQHAKLKFEDALQTSGLNYSIVRPTAYFKSLTGQVKRIEQNRPFLFFGTGSETACTPISKGDLAEFILDTIGEPASWNKVLPIGGPKPALTPADMAAIISKIYDKPIVTRSISPKIFDVLRALFTPLVPMSRWAREKSELMNIGKYYATESMLVWDAVNGCYDAKHTPSTGQDTFYDHVVKMRETGSLETVDNDTRLF